MLLPTVSITTHGSIFTNMIDNTACRLTLVIVIRQHNVGRAIFTNFHSDHDNVRKKCVKTRNKDRGRISSPANALVHGVATGRGGRVTEGKREPPRDVFAVA